MAELEARHSSLQYFCRSTRGIQVGLCMYLGMLRDMNTSDLSLAMHVHCHLSSPFHSLTMYIP